MKNVNTISIRTILIFILIASVTTSFKSFEQPTNDYCKLTIISNNIIPRTIFKVFKSDHGCPKFNDLPGAKDYIGKVKLSKDGKTIKIPTNTKVYIFPFSPKDTRNLMSKGKEGILEKTIIIETNAKEAQLTFDIDSINKPQWKGSDNLILSPGTSCLEKKIIIHNTLYIICFVGNILAL
jgi:hypothetical protein